jgi:iron complex outermembrane receptor protein
MNTKLTNLRKIIVFFLILIYFPSFSQVVDSLNQSILELPLEDVMKLPVKSQTEIEVVSASKIRQDIKYAPNVIDVVFKPQIKRYGFISINDALNTQPSFFYSQDFDRRTVGFRGMFESWNNNHILIQIDGIPHNDNLYGTAYTWENTPLVFLKNMEIIRGAGGALYGTNAMNGVVSLTSLNKEDIEKGGEFRARVGNQGTQIYDVLLGAEGKLLGSVISFNHFKTNGLDYDSYDRSGRVDDNGNLKKFNVNDERTSQYFFLKLYGKEKLDGLSLQYHLQHWEFGTGLGWIFQIPDIQEVMKENRNILALKYSPRKVERMLNYEISTRYQVHEIDWFMRYFPSSEDSTATYPDGLTEYLQTKAQDLFIRTQADLNTNVGLLLAGVEFNRFFYNGDKEHFSNVNLSGDYLPFPNNEWKEVGAFLEFSKGHPVSSIGAFAQYISPKFFQKIQLTLSGRFDNQSFDYNSIYEVYKPLKHKNFQQFTPRVALVFNATQKLTFKVIAGRAFRYPTPTEMFGANTYALASNIEQLKAETVNNYDFSVNYEISNSLAINTNAFYVDFKNQIAYSEANANLYSLKTIGLETGIKLNLKKLSGFANFTLSKRIDEQLQDSLISVKDDKIAWAPAQRVNIGVNYNHSRYYASMQIQYQGKAIRRNSDIFEGMEQYRPLNQVDAWVNTTVKFGYFLTPKLEVGLMASNLLNQKQYLIKPNKDWTDYQRERRRILVDVVLKF